MAKKEKITKIDPSVVLKDEKSLTWYRERLDPVRQFCWDKCIEGLSNTKAMGKWPELMKKLEEYVALVDIQSSDAVLDMNWDVVATREATADAS